jgi:hypothetical protein
MNAKAARRRDRIDQARKGRLRYQGELVSLRKMQGRNLVGGHSNDRAGEGL